ncbi:hypothetical protein [Cellulomonas iranensis]|uniref:hypothetical protein n=1 Tax=Cellulomonas iranensis TaxID=76862 RepID=UPI000B3D4A3B|nr:hypothetical protein [Cellulomonas iranensis]
MTRQRPVPAARTGALVSASPQALAEIREFFDRQDERARTASVARARTLADLHRRRNIEWDVVSRIAMRRTVFDVLGSMPGPRCGVRRPPIPGVDAVVFCSRREEHGGRHLMGAGRYVVAVWSGGTR